MYVNINDVCKRQKLNKQVSLEKNTIIKSVYLTQRVQLVLFMFFKQYLLKTPSITNRGTKKRIFIQLKKVNIARSKFNFAQK